VTAGIREISNGRTRNGPTNSVFINIEAAVRPRRRKIAFQVGNHQQGWRAAMFRSFHKQGESIMQLSAPKQATFWIAVILAVLALLGQLAIAALAPYAFWLLLIAFVLLALGNFVAGL
jgi:hypothetical protein